MWRGEPSRRAGDGGERRIGEAQLQDDYVAQLVVLETFCHQMQIYGNARLARATRLFYDGRPCTRGDSSGAMS